MKENSGAFENPQVLAYTSKQMQRGEESKSEDHFLPLNGTHRVQTFTAFAQSRKTCVIKKYFFSLISTSKRGTPADFRLFPLHKDYIFGEKGNNFTTFFSCAALKEGKTENICLHNTLFRVLPYC